MIYMYGIEDVNGDVFYLAGSPIREDEVTVIETGMGEVTVMTDSVVARTIVSEDTLEDIRSRLCHT